MMQSRRAPTRRPQPPFGHLAAVHRIVQVGQAARQGGRKESVPIRPRSSPRLLQRPVKIWSWDWIPHCSWRSGILQPLRVRADRGDVRDRGDGFSGQGIGRPEEYSTTGAPNSCIVYPCLLQRPIKIWSWDWIPHCSWRSGISSASTCASRPRRCPRQRRWLLWTGHRAPRRVLHDRCPQLLHCISVRNMWRIHRMWRAR